MILPMSISPPTVTLFRNDEQSRGALPLLTQLFFFFSLTTLSVELSSFSLSLSFLKPEFKYTVFTLNSGLHSSGSGPGVMQEMRICDGGSIQCLTCGKTYSNVSTFHRHKKREGCGMLEKPNFACPFPGCTSVFTRKDNLKSHYDKRHLLKPSDTFVVP